jgi:uncharacterized protein YbjT (DUF2867 family)
MGHVIFGTGAIGMAVMETLVDRGEQVRMINRAGTTEVPVGVDVLVGDASDPEFARRAAAGATVVYQALNPAYTKWPELFPALQAGVLAGAEAAGAKLVVMDNAYGFERAFGITATPVSEAIAQTLDWYMRGRDREVGQLTRSPAS